MLVLVLDTSDATSGVLLGSAPTADLLDLLAEQIGAAEANSGQTPTAVVLNPADLATVRKATASTAGTYVVNPLSTGPTSVYGVPPIPTANTDQGTAHLLTSGFGTFYTLGTLRVETGHSGDDFDHNRFTVRVEERVLPVVNRPTLVTKLTLTA